MALPVSQSNPLNSIHANDVIRKGLVNSMKVDYRQACKSISLSVNNNEITPLFQV
jgi:hypothetical protein